MPSPSSGRAPSETSAWPGVDADAELELGLLVEDPVTDRERGAYGALCVVLVRDRRAEDRHHRVADELLHRAAEALELVPQAGVVRAEQRAHLLRIHLLGARREAHEIGEEDGDDLALFEPRPPRPPAAPPQALQNRAASGFCWPQRGHVSITPKPTPPRALAEGDPRGACAGRRPLPRSDRARRRARSGSPRRSPRR